MKGVDLGRNQLVAVVGIPTQTHTPCSVVGFVPYCQKSTQAKQN